MSVCGLVLNNMQTLASFCVFSFEQQLTENTVDFSGIRTRIVMVEGENVDRLSTTTVPRVE